MSEKSEITLKELVNIMPCDGCGQSNIDCECEDDGDDYEYVTMTCDKCEEEYNLPECALQCPFCGSFDLHYDNPTTSEGQ